MFWSDIRLYLAYILWVNLCLFVCMQLLIFEQIHSDLALLNIIVDYRYEAQSNIDAR